MATRIGDFIKDRREELEMTQVDLAAQLPIVADTLAAIEAGEIGTPSDPVLSALAEALNVAKSRLEDLLPADAEPGDEVGTTGSSAFSLQEIATGVGHKMADRAALIERAFLTAEKALDDLDQRIEALE